MATGTFWRKWLGKRGNKEKEKKKKSGNVLEVVGKKGGKGGNVLEEVVREKGKKEKKKSGMFWRKW